MNEASDVAGNRPKNRFLTGVPGIGKTTALNRILAGYRGSIGGYYTERDYLEDGKRFWLVDRITGKRHEMARVFNDDTGLHPIIYPDAFDDFAIRAVSRECSLLALDEIGAFEEGSEAFKAAVHAALDSDKPVWGVLKLKDTPFVRSVAERKDVEIITITAENREAITWI